MNNSEYFFLAYVLGTVISAVVFLILFPVFGYKQGKKVNEAKRYASMYLAVGGALFFAALMFIGYLEAGPFNFTHSGYEGIIFGSISFLGVLATTIGIVARLATGSRK